MSRFSLEDDRDDVDDVRPNATCSDCAAEYSRADHDPGTLCDACCDVRAAWVDALELRMAKAHRAGPDHRDVA